MLGGEGPPRLFNHFQVPGADVAVADELLVCPAVCTGIVWLAHCQEVGREVTSDHLPGVYKNVSGKKSKCKHPYKESRKKSEWGHALAVGFRPREEAVGRVHDDTFKKVSKVKLSLHLYLFRV